MEFACPYCGSPIFVEKPIPKWVKCQACWNLVQLHQSFDLLSLLAGVAIGAIIIGPLIWTEFGKVVAITAIAKGAKTAEKTVKGWMELGERVKAEYRAGLRG